MSQKGSRGEKVESLGITKYYNPAHVCSDYVCLCLIGWMELQVVYILTNDIEV